MAALLLGAITLFAVQHSAFAQGFSAVISPPRFELTVQAGKTSRQIIEITHVASSKGSYRVYTNDWSLGADGNAIFTDELAPNSCRPWVALEKKELALAPNGKIRFRFEIAPPVDAPSTECRFAIMIEGLEQVIKTEGALSFPVSGRIGVVVYATVGDARAKLDITPAGVAMHESAQVPQLQVRNTGNAHGRLGGFLIGVDAKGKKIDFVPEALPILPGQTRMIPLVPNVPGTDSVVLNYPLTIKGSLEWSDQKTPLDVKFDAPAARVPASAIAPVPANAAPAPKAKSVAPTPASK
ncbi:MAG: hypothetical protein ABI905_10835 [Betaproteobacteria bacterium]